MKFLSFSAFSLQSSDDQIKFMVFFDAKVLLNFLRPMFPNSNTLIEVFRNVLTHFRVWMRIAQYCDGFCSQISWTELFFVNQMLPVNCAKLLFRTTVTLNNLHTDLYFAVFNSRNENLIQSWIFYSMKLWCVSLLYHRDILLTKVTGSKAGDVDLLYR